MEYMRDEMKKSSEGNEILTLKPRINSQTVDLKQLKDLPEGTLGRVYVDFLDKNVSCKLSWDKRLSYIILESNTRFETTCPFC